MTNNDQSWLSFDVRLHLACTLLKQKNSLLKISEDINRQDRSQGQGSEKSVSVRPWVEASYYTD